MHLRFLFAKNGHFLRSSETIFFIFITIIYRKKPNIFIKIQLNNLMKVNDSDVNRYQIYQGYELDNL